MNCPECGVELREEGNFCKNCGKSLTESVSKNRNVTIFSYSHFSFHCDFNISCIY